MQSIRTKEDLEKSIYFILNIIRNPEIKSISKDIKQSLFDEGFEMIELGSEKKSYTRSKELINRQFKTTNYANGYYVGVGISARSTGSGLIYRGIVKKVELYFNFDSVVQKAIEEKNYEKS